MGKEEALPRVFLKKALFSKESNKNWEREVPRADQIGKTGAMRQQNPAAIPAKLSQCRHLLLYALDNSSCSQWVVTKVKQHQTPQNFGIPN